MERISQEKIQIAKAAVRGLYLNDVGQPMELTDGQAEIYAAICMCPEIPRVWIAASTQYGKSEVASQAILSLISMSPTKVLIIGPSENQAKIIMGRVIDHVFDNPMIESLVEFEGSKDRFRRERSKTKVDFKTAGTVQVLTADARNVSKQAKSLMGFGADLILVEESSLIPDSMYSKILRMVGGTGGKIVQLGNTWERNHFYSASLDPNYYHIHIDYLQALKEGRYSEAFINEAKATVDPIDWQVFYETKFPDSISDALIPMVKIEEAIEKDLPEGPKFFGGDVARFGGDKTIGVIRAGAKVHPLFEASGLDTMQTVGFFRHIIDRNAPEASGIDVIGVGSGVVDRLNEEGYNVMGINVAERSSDTEKFSNLRAEIFWGLRTRFIDGDISIPRDIELIRQLGEIRYNYNSRGQIVIESKESMKKRGIRSPDRADALALAFHTRVIESNISIVFA